MEPDWKPDLPQDLAEPLTCCVTLDAGSPLWSSREFGLEDS